VLFSGRVRVRIGCSVWLVSGYAHVFVLLSAVIVSRPSVSVHRVGAAVLSEPDENADDERRALCQHVAVQGAQDEGRLPPAQHVRRRRPASVLHRRVLGAREIRRRSHQRHPAQHGGWSL